VSSVLTAAVSKPLIPHFDCAASAGYFLQMVWNGVSGCGYPPIQDETVEWMGHPFFLWEFSQASTRILTPATNTCRRGPRDLGHPPPEAKK